VHHAVRTENEAAAMDSLILCKFLRGVFDNKFAAMAEMLRLVTGIEHTAESLERAAARIVDAKKRYNISQGWTPGEDTLPQRFLTTAWEDSSGARATLSAERLQELIRSYNLARGWSADGYPAEA
jgi:aldehyde:ferredoxin oxidoreductase